MGTEFATEHWKQDLRYAAAEGGPVPWNRVYFSVTWYAMMRGRGFFWPFGSAEVQGW